MADFTVSTDIDTFLQSADNAAARASIGADVRTDANGAFSAGDLGGDARGTNAINIQASRSAVTQVASGTNSVAIGNRSTASGYYGENVAIGYNAFTSHDNTVALGSHSIASHDYATAVGDRSVASALYSTAVGRSADASAQFATAVGFSPAALGDSSTAVGSYAASSGDRSTAVGRYAKTTVNNSSEIGYWSGSTTRAGAIRVHGTGMVALTVEETNTAYTDGLATAGSEADGTLMRKGMAFRVTTAGNLIVTYCDAAGAITSKDLGAMT
jgi:hypothetical protein